MIYTRQNTYFGKYQKLKVPNESSGPFPVTHSIIAYGFFQMHTLMNCSPIFHYIRTKIAHVQMYTSIISRPVAAAQMSQTYCFLNSFNVAMVP